MVQLLKANILDLKEIRSSEQQEERARPRAEDKREKERKRQ